MIGSHDLEAKNSHEMLTASWRTRKAGDIIQTEFKGPIIVYFVDVCLWMVAEGLLV
jgi:hypothetical protein